MYVVPLSMLSCSFSFHVMEPFVLSTVSYVREDPGDQIRSQYGLAEGC